MKINWETEEKNWIINRCRNFYSQDSILPVPILLPSWVSCIFEIQVFDGNTDGDSVVYHSLPTAITTRYIRVHPKTWHSHISMRVEFHGCYIGKDLCYLLDGRRFVRAFSRLDWLAGKTLQNPPARATNLDEPSTNNVNSTRAH